MNQAEVAASVLHRVCTRTDMKHQVSTLSGPLLDAPEPARWIGPEGQTMPNEIYKAWAPRYPEMAALFRPTFHARAMAWTTDKPTTPGWYWVWTPDYPCHGEACATKVELNTYGKLTAWVRFTNYDEPLSVTESGEWIGAQWMGPIEAPAAPEVKR